MDGASPWAPRDPLLKHWWPVARQGPRRQLAIVGTFEGTAFIDVTDGTSPIYLGTLPTAADPDDIGNIWGDVRVYGDTT